MPNRWCRTTAYPIAAGSAATTTGKTIGSNRSRSGRTSDSGATTTYIDTMNTAATANVATSPRTSRSRTARTAQPDRSDRRRADQHHATHDAQDGDHRMEPVLWAVQQGRDREYRDGRHLGVEHPAPPAFRHAVREHHDEQWEQGQTQGPQRAAEAGTDIAQWALAQQPEEDSPAPGSSPGRRRRRRGSPSRHVAAGATAARRRPARRTRTARRPGTSPRAPQGSTRRRAGPGSGPANPGSTRRNPPRGSGTCSIASPSTNH